MYYSLQLTRSFLLTRSAKKGLTHPRIRQSRSSISSQLSIVPPLDVICLGELLIDFVPSQPHAPLARTKSLRIAPGGAPANVAVALTRLGLAAGFIGKAGDDPFGRYLHEVLRHRRLDLEL